MARNDEVALRPGVVFPAPAPDIDRSWMTGVHEVARLTGTGIVGERQPPCVGRSFYRVSFAHGGKASTLMMNPAARVVACVEGDRPFPADAKYTSVSHPEVFTRIGFVVADPTAMERPWIEADLVDLSDEEATQVRYHRPLRIGDIVFNWFD